MEHYADWTDGWSWNALKEFKTTFSRQDSRRGRTGSDAQKAALKPHPLQVGLEILLNGRWQTLLG